MKKLLFIVVVAILCSYSAFSQINLQSTPSLPSLKGYNAKFLNSKLTSFRKQLSNGDLSKSNVNQIKNSLAKTQKRTTRFIKSAKKSKKTNYKKLIRIETKLKRRLCKTNPKLADEIFNPKIYRLAPYHNKYSNDTKGKSIQFNDLNQAKLSLDYVDMNTCIRSSSLQDSKIKKYKTNFKDLNTTIEKAESDQNFYDSRNQQLQDAFINNKDHKKLITKYSKTSFYNGQKLNDLKQMFAKESTIENEILSTFENDKSFQEFAKFNSYLKTIEFDKNKLNNIDGIPTIDDAKNSLEASLNKSSVNSISLLDKKNSLSIDSLKASKQNFTKKLKSNRFYFKPNLLKTKPFKDRIDFQFDFAFRNSNLMQPKGGDLSLGASYQIRQNISAGLSGSYSFGIQNKIKDLLITSESLGIRSFAFYSITEILKIQIGYEMTNTTFNYKFFKNYSFKNGVAPIGIRVVNPTKSKNKEFFTIQYNLFRNTSVPPTSAIIYRIGLTF